jgi:carbonic anhydrase/acetyltransferase-like protein (isoleucine patch superfamily)
MITGFSGALPKLGRDVFIAPDAWVIGDVRLDDNVSIFFGAVLRGDILPITVGRGSNIQEHAMLHTSRKRTPTVVGQDVTVGHRAIIHGCTIGDRSLVGMGAVILDETIVEEDCIIAAGTVLPERKRIPAKSMVMGVPGKVVRTLSEDEIRALPQGSRHYVELGRQYRDLFLEKI